MKWIVFWTLFGAKEISCGQVGCLAYHFTLYEEQHSDTFIVKKQAVDFYDVKIKDSKSYRTDFMKPYMSTVDVRIEEIKTNQ